MSREANIVTKIRTPAAPARWTTRPAPVWRVTAPATSWRNAKKVAKAPMRRAAVALSSTGVRFQVGDTKRAIATMEQKTNCPKQAWMIETAARGT